MNYQKIWNPKNNKMVSIFSATGKEVLRKYLQNGGHEGPCSLNSKGTRCKVSSQWDHENCILSKKGNCKKKVKKQAEAKPVKLDASAKLDTAVQAGVDVITEGSYTNPKSGLTETQRKFCRCVLHLAKNNPDWCNREKAWPKRQQDGKFKDDPRGKCYNPWAVCTSKLKRKGRTPKCDYLFTLPGSSIPYDEVLAYILLNYQKIHSWVEQNMEASNLDDIINSGNENLVRDTVEEWYYS